MASIRSVRTVVFFARFQQVSGLVEHGLGKVHASAEAAVRIEKTDGDGFAGDDFVGDESHGFGFQHSSEPVVFIIARQHHALELAAVRQQGNGGGFPLRFRRRGFLVRRLKSGRKQDQGWKNGAQ